MHRPIAGLLDLPRGEGMPALLTISISFFLGSAAGCGLAASTGGEASESLSAYLQAFLVASGAGEMQAPSLLPLIWETFRWSALVVLLGFTVLGLFGIPILFAARGFVLSFAVATFIRLLGGMGGVLAFLLFGLTGLISLPVLFVLGTQGMGTSRQLAGRAMGEKVRPLWGKGYLLRCGCCAGALCVCVVLESLSVMPLVGAVAGAFLN